MGYDHAKEWPLIKEAASKYGVNPYFMAAIRRAEDGGPGREFGVLSVEAPSYEEQLKVACLTVAHRMVLFHGGAHSRINGVSVMSFNFIQWFAHIWAPLGVGNDPHNLNANWPDNVEHFQDEAVRNA